MKEGEVASEGFSVQESGETQVACAHLYKRIPRTGHKRKYSNPIVLERSFSGRGQRLCYAMAVLRSSVGKEFFEMIAFNVMVVPMNTKPRAL